MQLLEFYRQTLENLNFHIDKEGYIYIKTRDTEELVTCGGKPLVLPTKEQINSIYQKDEDGKYEVTKIPYNPLNEDVIKGDSESIKKLKSVIEYKLSHVIFAIGELLLTLAADNKLQRKANGELIVFLGNLRKAILQGQRGGVVDEKSIDNWTNIYANLIKEQEPAFTIYLKKKGVIGDKTYTRLATLSSTILDDLDELIETANDNSTFRLCKVALRKKDVIVYKEIFNFILPELSKLNTVSVGSNDNEAPTFISLYSLFIKITKRNNYLLDELKDINKKVYKSYYVENLMEEEELEDIRRYKTELLDIPSDIDLYRAVSSKNTNRVDNANRIPNNPYPTTPVKLQEKPQAGGDPLMKALYGSGYQQQQQQVQPIGLNTYQPQQFNQVVQPVAQPIGINQIQSVQPGYIPMAGGPNIGAPSSYYQPQQQVGLTGYIPMA